MTTQQLAAAWREEAARIRRDRHGDDRLAAEFDRVEADVLDDCATVLNRTEPRRDTAMTQPHMYLVQVGNVRGDTPQKIRKTAIDLAVNDVPDPGAQYEIVSGYTVTTWDDDLTRLRRGPDGGLTRTLPAAEGTGRLFAAGMTVRVKVPADQARWQAPQADAEGRKAAPRVAGDAHPDDENLLLTATAHRVPGFEAGIGVTPADWEPTSDPAVPDPSGPLA
jgi:hypothetical protein